MSQRCPLCFTRLLSEPICPDCIQEVLQLRTNHTLARCPHCLAYLGNNANMPCPNCRILRFKPQPYYYGFDYVFPFKRLILEYKQSKKMHYEKALIHLLIESLKAQNIQIDHEWTLIPLPSSHTALKKRHFNPVQRLTKIWSQSGQYKVNEHLLMRKYQKTQIKQASLSKNQRKTASWQQYFCIKPATEKKYLIIDDVLTTGNTLNNAYDALKAAGANTIGALTFARSFDIPTNL